ncbi:MAG: ECF transporter S component, partial [Leucobacter sp.]
MNSGYRPRVSTRTLLVCAAIGAGGGMLAAATNIVMVAIATGLPLLFIALGGLWNVPILLAMALLRRPGAGLLAGLLSGLVAAPFSPVGPGMIYTQVLAALFFEAPFALLRYRRQPRILFFLAAIVLATQHSIVAYSIVGAGQYGAAFQYALWIGRPLSYCAVVWLALRLSDRLRRAGLGDGAPGGAVPVPISGASGAPISGAPGSPASGAGASRDAAVPHSGPDSASAADGAPPLLVSDLSVRYPGRERSGPHGVSLELAPGEVLLVLGPSGSGKSSLALALNGLVPQAIPAEVGGEVRVAGVPATRRTAELADRIGMVLQDPDAQIATACVLDEVRFGPQNLGLPAAETEARAERALSAVGLWDRRADDPAELSGGGRQRLAIACALAMRAPVIVLDEPTANLDPAGVLEVYAVLRALVAAGGVSIVLVEHALDAAIELVDRVAVLGSDGRILCEGPARETLAAHARELLRLGVWLPTSVLAALRLADAGIDLEPMPFTPAELSGGGRQRLAIACALAMRAPVIVLDEPTAN